MRIVPVIFTGALIPLFVARNSLVWHDSKMRGIRTISRDQTSEGRVESVVRSWPVYDRKWPNFTVPTFTSGPVARYRERQVSVANRSYSELLYWASLAGGSRPNPDVEKISL